MKNFSTSWYYTLLRTKNIDSYFIEEKEVIYLINNYFKKINIHISLVMNCR